MRGILVSHKYIYVWALVLPPKLVRYLKCWLYQLSTLIKLYSHNYIHPTEPKILN